MATTRAAASGGSLRYLVVPSMLVAIPAVAGSLPSHGERSLADSLRYGPGIVNHPVGVVPSEGVRIPEGWPLDVDGSITCLTCHYKLSLEDGSGDAKLPGLEPGPSATREFCATCHSDVQGPGRASHHWLASRFAHIREDVDCAGYAGGGLDAESRRCLGCHDGVNAPDAVNNHGGVAGSSVGWSDRLRRHPVGVHYGTVRHRKSGAALRPESVLPDRVRLPEGKLSCVSCHDLYAAEPKLLSVPAEESRLCLTCHAFN